MLNRLQEHCCEDSCQRPLKPGLSGRAPPGSAYPSASPVPGSARGSGVQAAAHSLTSLPPLSSPWCSIPGQSSRSPPHRKYGGFLFVCSCKSIMKEIKDANIELLDEACKKRFSGLSLRVPYWEDSLGSCRVSACGGGPCCLTWRQGAASR